MEGGIRAWRGLKATGGPEAGMPYFSPAANLEEVVALAWALEQGSQRFYAHLAEQQISHPQAASLFKDLSRAEEHHQEHLLDAYRNFTGTGLPVEEVLTAFGRLHGGETMEGNVLVEEALGWTRDRDLPEILELAMGLEINSYDLYLKMSQRAEEEAERQVFKALAEEEQRHLERLGEVMEGLGVRREA